MAHTAAVGPPIHETYMLQALQVAKCALRKGEVPVGCIIVYHPSGSKEEEGIIVSHGANMVNATRDATRHAELVAIDRVLSRGVSSDQLCLPTHVMPESYRTDDDDECKMIPIKHCPSLEWNKCDLYVTVRI